MYALVQFRYFLAFITEIFQHTIVLHFCFYVLYITIFLSILYYALLDHSVS